MKGTIKMGIKNDLIAIVNIENYEIIEYSIKNVREEDVPEKMEFVNWDGFPMTDEEEEVFYDENANLIELLADLKVLLK